MHDGDGSGHVLSVRQRGHSIAAFFRAAMPPRVADESVLRFADALAWNWIVGGPDGHATNYSILLAGRALRLAPIYDVTSGLAYWPERELKVAMKIGDDYALVDDRDPWPVAARNLGLPVDMLRERVMDLCRRSADAFATASADPEVTALGSPLPARLTDLVAGRSGRCLSLLETGRPAR
jgi:serine/threonine-protein kinase HipA